MALVIEPDALARPLARALARGLAIGAAAGGLILVNGRVAGIAGILAGVTGKAAAGWQGAFLAGLLLAGLCASGTGAKLPPAFAQMSLPLLAAAGLLVGVGTRLGNGCTSGHGVCGIARFSHRSLAATSVFMAVAAAVVFVTRHIMGAG